MTANTNLGAFLQSDGQCQFTVWGPELDSVELRLVSPQAVAVPMERDQRGYWTATLGEVTAGAHYWYCINGDESALRPDPASFYQPKGVHGPSAVVDLSRYEWGDAAWLNIPWADYVIYELHIGTFTAAGTFEAAIARLPDLVDLGITAVEIMPVAQFPGDRNWGYDGVFPYATQNSYGGPDGLKRLVDACHQQGLAVILDVVYNHFGPEGNYSGCFGPYTTEKYSTPWGGAINFDDAWSDDVRQYCIDNALYWLREFHIDGLRLDAIHAIYDFGAKHLLAELAEAVSALGQQLGKPLYLAAESDLNDSRILRPADQGGYGLTAQWSDDFHHALHSLVTGEDYGYYEDFGTCEALARSFGDRFVYSGQYSPFRRRSHGNSASDLPSSQFIVCAQNHDQVGNATGGDRTTKTASFEALKLAAGAVLTSPYIPLIFMGEEYGETAPFNYFIDHSDPELIQAIYEGRKREFKAAHGFGEPAPAHEVATFNAAKLSWDLRHQGQHKTLWHYYQRLLKLRRQLQLGMPSTSQDIYASADEEHRVVCYKRTLPDGALWCGMNFSTSASPVDFSPPVKPWVLQLDSAHAAWGGPGSSLPKTIADPQSVTLAPQSFVLYLAT
ncbi:MAG: malto-oligosyltrehalose trehalohydrolase [Leptolyngbya sp.]|uniref:Malto-oligosyltrehalose trehalohydrolase n=1 Tax=Shackletoniella antarctica TaxID=268115 RepID=A0A2W4XSF5_9CYAN|nr:MAG: malto-oligosyltrehalose trehalohydrolase [Shackletoniella antarctica]PZV19733.1 MAG: malto-oligosyltrehalose trehalohydrolase [Leptolyngbya sp.]